MRLKINIIEDFYCQLIHWKNKKYFDELRSLEGQDISLIPFDQFKTIFVHIPKTGGVSVSKSLFGVRSGGHSKTTRYKKIYGIKRFYDYYKFCFVRNPFTKILSGYNYFKKGGYSEKDKQISVKLINQFDSFDDFVKRWVNSENIWKIIHFHPQNSFICNRNKQVEVDFVGRFETLEEDFKMVSNVLSIDVSLPHHNKSKTYKDWTKIYSHESLKIVEEVYQDDFELFNYKKLSK